MFTKDPLQVFYWERRLGRKLTEDERLGEKAVLIDGRRVRLELRDVHFPYDFMGHIELIATIKRLSK